MPLGYTYPSYLTHEVFDPLDPVQKQEALLQGILLEKEDTGDFPDTIGEADLVFTGYGIPYRVKCGKGVRQEGKRGYLSSRKNSKITLTIGKVESCELYLFATGVRARAETERGLDSIYNDLEHTDFKITVRSGAGSGTIAYKTPCKRSYCGQEDFLVNLGYQEEARTEITVTFPIQGRYQLEDLKVICQPMGHYAEQVNALREDVLEDEEIGVDHIKGSVTLEKDKILCLTVPYCKGWTAYVDGVEKPLYKANEMYMALPLTAGEHAIELCYETYGLRAGLCISGVGVLLFLAGCIRRRKESRHPH